MRKYSSNRRHDTSDRSCQCGYSRKAKKWVRNGCKFHPVEALKPSSFAYTIETLKDNNAYHHADNAADPKCHDARMLEIEQAARILASHNDGAKASDD